MSSYDVLSPNENFRGMSYGEWAAEWWNWLLSEKPDIYSQEDPVLFLRGAFDYKAGADGKRTPGTTHNDRQRETINVYEGTAIFFPVIEAEFNFDDPDPDDGAKKIETEARIRFLARRDIDEGDEMGATIQIGAGGPKTKIVDDLKRYRAESPLFRLMASDKSILKDKLETLLPGNGAFDAVTDGYWILIRSLPPSNEPYRIHFEAKGRHNYSNSATYDIIVKPKPASRVEDKSDSLISGKSIV